MSMEEMARNLIIIQTQIALMQANLSLIMTWLSALTGVMVTIGLGAITVLLFRRGKEGDL